LVPDMHAQGHVRLAPVAAEVAFADQEADQESEVELRWHGTLPVVSPSCYTGNVGDRAGVAAPLGRSGILAVHRRGRVHARRAACSRSGPAVPFPAVISSAL